MVLLVREITDDVTVEAGYPKVSMNLEEVLNILCGKTLTCSTNDILGTRTSIPAQNTFFPNVSSSVFYGEFDASSFVQGRVNMQHASLSDCRRIAKSLTEKLINTAKAEVLKDPSSKSVQEREKRYFLAATERAAVESERVVTTSQTSPKPTGAHSNDDSLLPLITESDSDDSKSKEWSSGFVLPMQEPFPIDTLISDAKVALLEKVEKQPVFIKVRSMHTNDVTIKIKSATTKFFKIMKAYAQFKNWEIESIHLVFKSFRIHAEDTFESLGMQNGDQVDAVSLGCAHIMLVASANEAEEDNDSDGDGEGEKGEQEEGEEQVEEEEFLPELLCESVDESDISSVSEEESPCVSEGGSAYVSEESEEESDMSSVCEKGEKEEEEKQMEKNEGDEKRKMPDFVIDARTTESERDSWVVVEGQSSLSTDYVVVLKEEGQRVAE